MTLEQIGQANEALKDHVTGKTIREIQRAKPPAGADVSSYPKAYLQATPGMPEWHKFGMEWKEHVAWLCPMLATAVAYVVIRYGPQLAHEVKIRRALMVLFSVAFMAAMVAGGLGAALNKVAPNNFLNI